MATLTEAEYLALARACDAALLAPDSTVERVAIPWLHVLREHPFILRQYERVFTDDSDGVAPASVLNRKTTIRAFLGRQRRRLLKSLDFLREFLAPWQRGSPPAGLPANLPNDVDILFVSHLLNPGQAGRSRDFYYGDTPNMLARQGYRCLVVLLNQTNRPSQEYKVSWGPTEVPRVVLPHGGYRKFGRDRRLSREARRLSFLANAANDDLTRRVFRFAAREATADPARSALGIGESIGRLAAATRAKSIITTYEGHAWERIAYCSARRALPGIRCLGYHQACLFPLQHAMKRSLQPEYNPDRIVTAGPYTRAELAEAPGLGGIPVSVFGSDRGLEDTSETSASAWNRSRAAMESRPTCVVLPEGMETECAILFDFAVEVARVLPELRFLFRMHPNLAFDVFADQNPRFRDLQKNVTISENDLEADLATSSWALYRGTTAIFRAVLAGLRPLYLAREGEMSIDSLRSPGAWKRTLNNREDFIQIIGLDRESAPDSRREFEGSFFYCATFFQPYDPETLVEAALGEGSER